MVLWKQDFIETTRLSCHVTAENLMYLQGVGCSGEK